MIFMNRGFGFDIGFDIGRGRRSRAAADAAEGAADVAVEESESGGHESAEVRDCEKCQWNTEDGVDDRHYLTPRRLRRNVSVT